MMVCIRNTAHLDVLHATCARLTPRIERHPDALVLDLAGCARHAHRIVGPYPALLPATWTDLAAALAHHLEGVGPGPAAVWIGLGPSRTAAWLATDPSGASTDSAAWRVVATSQVAAFLRSLPVAALLSLPELHGLPSAVEVVEALAHSGLRTIGAVARLSAGALRRRFGPLGATLTMLATGQDVMPFRVWAPAPWLGVRWRCDPPAVVSAVSQVARMLLPLACQLARTLADRHVEACEVALVLHTAEGASWRASRCLGQPTSSPLALHDHAHRLLARLAEATPTMTGLAVAAVHLRVGRLRPVAPPQDVLWLQQSQRDRRAARGRLARLLASGAGTSVLRAQCAAPHAVLPEERYALVLLGDMRRGAWAGATTILSP